MKAPHPSPEAVQLAEAVRDACLRAALDAFTSASMSGLCCTGAWECAVGAVRTLDVEAVLRAGREPDENGAEEAGEAEPG